MEVEASTTADTSVAAPVEAAPAPATEVAAPAEKPAGGDITQPEAKPVADVYAPSLKYKVMDKEMEMDAWLKPAVTTKEQEARLKELYEKAYGIDEVKSSRDKFREEFKSYKTQAEPVVKTVREASNLYQNGVRNFAEGNVNGGVFKLEEAFKMMGIPDKVIQQYTFHKLNMEDLPAAQKHEYYRTRELEKTAESAQAQLQEQQQYIESIAIQTRQQELQVATSQQAVAGIVQAFNQRNGEGAFQQEVVLRGQQHWYSNKQDVPAQQLVQEIITKYGLQAPAQQQAAPSVQEAKPVIPTVKGSTGSPAGRTFNSAEDLKKYRQEQYGY